MWSSQTLVRSACVAGARVLSALVLALCLLGAPAAHSAERVALVIGNSAYRHLPRLVNPVNDATDVTQSLQRVGFKVTTIKDAGFETLRVALLEFGRQAADADMAVVFYAGHGIEVAGENWLLPVDGQLKTDADVNSEAMNLRTVMLAVSDAKTLGLVILDACRNNVFANIVKSSSTRAVDRGLAPVDPAENVLVAYAARDGTTAADGAGRNSPFTSALLRHLETPGLELEFLFRNVRDDVWAATNGGQQPFLYGSLSKDEIYLKAAEDAPVVTATAAPSAPSEVAEASQVAEASDVAWSFLRNTSDADTLRRFVELFPDSSQVPAARQRVAALETAQKSDAAPSGAIFSLASDETTQVEEEDIKKTRPYHKSTPAVEAAWNVLKDSKDATVIRRFADRFPSSRRRAAVEHRPIRFVGAKVALANPQDPPPAPKVISRDVLLQAAEDPDVLRCFRLDDLSAPECHSALERYPLISQFTYDYRFRFTLCQALGDACGGKPPRMLQSSNNLQAKALFNPVNADPAAVAAVPGGVVIAPATTAPTATNTNTTPSTTNTTPSTTNTTSSPDTVPNTVTRTTPDHPTTTHVIASPHVIVAPTTNPTTTSPTQHFRSGKLGHRTPVTTQQSNIAAKSLGGVTGLKNFGAHAHVGHSNIHIKTNVSIAAKSINIATPTVKTLTIRTPTVRIVTARTPTVRVPTVRVPTIRVPTVRVPAIRIP
jgi:uncharacterized caspase-like protein